ncbi:MAG: hypothetical protein LUE24_14715 [Lachnospiraceae bacterium]|nr:hypothetical protein [Lachnospiraceae bacterium]
MANEGISKLAGVIHNRVAGMGDAAYGSLVLDFGEIQDDYSLLTNTYPLPIPQSDYLVCRQLTLGDTGDILAKTQEIGAAVSGAHQHSVMDLTCSSHGGSVTGTVGTSAVTAQDAPVRPDAPVSSLGSDTTDGQHQHHVLIPEMMRWLKPGDRVLVAWVQHDAVVIDIIRPATDIQ